MEDQTVEIKMFFQILQHIVDPTNYKNRKKSFAFINYAHINMEIGQIPLTCIETPCNASKNK